jgi:hypothetical protein
MFHLEVWSSLSKWYIYFRFFTSTLEVWYRCIPCHLDSKRAQGHIFCIIHWSRIQHNIWWLNWAGIDTSRFSWHNCIHRLRIRSLTYKSGNPQCMQGHHIDLTSILPHQLRMVRMSWLGWLLGRTKRQKQWSSFVTLIFWRWYSKVLFLKNYRISENLNFLYDKLRIEMFFTFKIKLNFSLKINNLG